MLSDNMPDFPLYQLSCVVFFLVPMIFIVILYARMGLRIRNNGLERSIESSVHGETQQAQSRKTIIRMLSAVVITFFICWAPFHAQRLLYVYQVSRFSDINEWLYPVGGSLYYFSTTVNPILYNVMSTKYRKAFRETLCCSPSNHFITRDDLSSTRDTTVCGSGSRRGSQVVRVRSVHYQRSMKYNSPGRTKEPLRTSSGTETNISINNEDISSNKMAVEPLLQEAKKPSFVVHASNGRPRCQTFGKDGSFSSETHI